MKINKNSSIYFVSFFTIVIFGFILILNLANSMLKDKIEHSKTIEVNNILSQNMTCVNPLKISIDDKSFYYCKKSNLIAIHRLSDFAYADKIEYMAFININTNTVENINIINHKETPGLGDKIADTKWLKTIYDKSVNLLKLKQDGGDIDSFTAASLTPSTFLKSLSKELIYIKSNNKNIIKIIQE